MTRAMLAPRVFVPHIQLIDGYWRVSKAPKFHFKLSEHMYIRWNLAHVFVLRLNEAREFGMVVPGTT